MLQPNLPFQTAGQSPNPWFTIANQFIPRNLHDVIRWSRYITIQSPTTSEVIRKLSTYPITDFIIDTNKDNLKTKYREILKSFKFKEALQNIGFEYYTIGNCFVSIYFPIQRSLVCPTCATAYSAKKAEFIRFKQYKFEGTCPHCSNIVEFKRIDTKSVNIADMNIIRWNPEHIVVNHNPITGEYEYFYTIPNAVKLKIQKGDKLFVNSIPWGFVEAVKFNQDFKFDQGNLFHLQNVTTGGTVDGVSVPPLLSLFSLVFYQATLRKANEAIATEYLNPMRVIFPQAQTGNSDPVISMSLKSFESHMTRALMKHKVDKNHILISPTPVGYLPIGGEGRNLLVSQEIQQAEASILLSLGVSQELLSGTTNWTSSSVGLRMMENMLTSYISRLQELIDWAMTKVATYLGIEVCEVTLEPFKLLDDDTLKQMLLNLSQAGAVSFTTFFEEIGLDFKEEMDKLKQEAVIRGRSSVETQYEVEEASTMAARDAGDQMRDNGEFQTLLGKAQSLAEEMYSMPEEDRRPLLDKLKTVDYTMYILLSNILNNAQNSLAEANEANPSDKEGSDAPGTTPEGKAKSSSKKPAGKTEKPKENKSGLDGPK